VYFFDLLKMFEFHFSKLIFFQTTWKKKKKTNLDSHDKKITVRPNKYYYDTYF
jgi:hypothetical protein